jgi:hypothetical protein
MKYEIAELKDIYEDKINNIAASIAISGGINVETNVKFNFLTNSYLITPLGKSLTDDRGRPIKNAISYDVKNATASIAFGQFVKGEVELKMSINYRM